MKNDNWIEERLNIDNTFKALVRYLELRRELYETDLKDYLARTLLSFVILLFVVGFILVILLFASLALALFLNEVINTTYGGFLIVAGLFFVVGFSIFLLRGRLITNVIYRLVFPQNHDESTETDE